MKGAPAAALLCTAAAVAVFSTYPGRAPAATPCPSDGALEGATLAQLAGQRIIYSYAGSAPPGGLLRRVRRGEAAGIILFARNIRSRAALRTTVHRLQRIPRPPGQRAPLLVMIDQEGGLVNRLPGAPRRSPALIGAIGRTSLALAEGRATARNLRSVGVNVNLAPVLDVGRPGSYQQRTGRSYSSSARRVALLGSAFARGLETREVAATLKHFPGLGVVRRNEDDAVQRVPLTRRQLRRVDEAPFAAGIAAGARLVMTSTGLYPAYSHRPALLSRRIVSDELRGRLRFDGVSITDDLEVPALRRYGRAPELAVQAAQAGNDLLLLATTYRGGDESRRALVAAVRSGRIARAQLRAAACRILTLRRSLGRPSD